MRLIAPTALLISPFEEDHARFRRLFAENGWTLHSARSLESAFLREPLPSVLITEADLRPGSWRTVVGRTGLLPNPPLVIVTSLHADERLWAEALNLGAHDVLLKPFDSGEVIRVLKSAWIRREEPGLTRKGMNA
jgi:DNA-binding response OmpR family regulator